jgi:AraC-like DNA-binding protein
MLACGCGFPSRALFARRFEERHGLTPMEFRQASRQRLRATRVRGESAQLPGSG